MALDYLFSNDLFRVPYPKVATVLITSHQSIDDIPASQWNALLEDGYPFLQHEVLSAMEKHDCVGEHTGWLPRHLTITDQGRLIGAIPIYEKHNSWGEFVFDHAWADAYYRAGIEYYPKLVNAIPFTPASGRRILVDRQQQETITPKIIDAAKTLLDEGGYSGLHCLFPSPEAYTTLNQQGAVSRNDCQFHWHHRGYENFDDFLGTLKPKKRKNIRQERRKVADAGLNIRRLNGHTANEQDWADFTRLYALIYNRKYGMPAFNHHYFMEVALAIPGQIHLVLVDDGSRALAGALMYSDHNTLYGRHWGCDSYVDCLHFEVCYYQGIEMCIENGWQRFDPGAQGEHKIARGFEATLMQSLHWMTDSPFNDAIAQFVSQEQKGVQRYINAVIQHSPYR